MVPAAGPSWHFPGQPTFAGTARQHPTPAVLANQWRPSEHLNGGSQIVDATGAILADAERVPDNVIVTDVRLVRARTAARAGDS